MKPILAALGDNDYVKMESTGFMDLHINRLYTPVNGAIRISLAHNYLQNGDNMADPDMEIRIYPELEMAEAMTFQQDGGIPIYQTVYRWDNGMKFVNNKLKKELNNFLNFWLGNIKKQGFFK